MACMHTLRAMRLSSAAFRSATRTFSAATASNVTIKRVVAQGAMTMSLPLPGKPGLTAVSTPLHHTVGDLLESLKEIDPSLPKAEITNGDGQRIAASTALAALLDTDLYVDVGAARVRVKGRRAGDDGESSVIDEAKYDALVQHVLTYGRPTMCVDAYKAFCRQLGADKHMSERWLEVLAADGLAAVIRGAKGATLLLSPGGDVNFKRNIADVLRRDDELLQGKIYALEEQLKEAEEKEKAMADLRETILARARRGARIKSAGVLGFLTLQFSGLFYLVYEVYSWDIMEPASYFLMLSYSVGSALYFSFKKREATFDNLLQLAIAKHQRQLEPEHGYSVAAHDDAALRVARIRRARDVLCARAGRKPLF
eukprot:TRINITY_DN1295_c0_g1_i4.p1 TRINITY_DN1295_c0_g1~~TRINITY_DN1295_c0_g1_i4.p1  ORF type:complete len:387 (-),score=175.74 TRINITY_DN1295_c0_g1_i4:658-1764(-)